MDRESITPLYEQLAAILRGRIQDKTYTGRLPSELDLASEFDVSRPTVRRARDLLVADGPCREVLADAERLEAHGLERPLSLCGTGPS